MRRFIISASAVLDAAKLILYQAPKLMGSDSRGLIDISGLTTMAQTPLLTITDVCMIDCDIRIMATVQNNK